MAKGFRGGGFGGKGAMGGMRQNDLMKQAQKMQEEMLRTQEELENRIYSIESSRFLVDCVHPRPLCAERKFGEVWTTVQRASFCFGLY